MIIDPDPGGGGGCETLVGGHAEKVSGITVDADGTANGKSGCKLHLSLLVLHGRCLSDAKIERHGSWYNRQDMRRASTYRLEPLLFHPCFHIHGKRSNAANSQPRQQRLRDGRIQVVDSTDLLC